MVRGSSWALLPTVSPFFFDEAFVGNESDIRARFGTDHWTAWSEHCRTEGSKRGYDMTALGDPDRVTEPINADIAASTQLLFEETYLAAVRALARMLAAGGQATAKLCLSGGTALNCPSNSRIWREGPFEEVFVEPTCDDGGLAIGAALHVHHNLLDNPLPETTAHATPYLGGSYSEEDVEDALALADGVLWSRPADAATAAAEDLMADKVIGWFEGGSEAGPRALGHRSILADVRLRRTGCASTR